MKRFLVTKLHNGLMRANAVPPLDRLIKVPRLEALRELISKAVEESPSSIRFVEFSADQHLFVISLLPQTLDQFEQRIPRHFRYVNIIRCKELKFISCRKKRHSQVAFDGPQRLFKESWAP